MTERHDDPWAPEDDELVRQALMSLMEDVSTQPLPEPSQIRARAEGRAEEGQVVSLASRRRRRSLVVLSAAAAAVLVATGAGLLVLNQDPDTPVATSTSDRPTSTTTSGTTAAQSRLLALGPGEWEGVLGVPVQTTAPGTIDDHCFTPPSDAASDDRTAKLADGTVIAGQSVVSPTGGKPAPTTAVDEAVTGCDGRTTDQTLGDDLPGGGAYRAWHSTRDQGGAGVWWVEVTDGQTLSFLTVNETGGRAYTGEEMRRLALGVLGEVDLTQTESSSTTTSSTPGPTSTSTSTSTTTEPTSPTATDSGSGSATGPSSTSTSGTSRPTPPVNTPTPPDTSVPVVGPVESRFFVPPARWSSQTLTGGAATSGGTLELEGKLTVDECVFTDADTPVGGVGIRSGPGEDNFFGRQFVFKDKTEADRANRLQSVLGAYSTDCGGGVDIVNLDGSDSMFRKRSGDLTTWIAVTKLKSGGVSVIHLTSPKNAPQPLTDATAKGELERLSGLAGGR